MKSKNAQIGLVLFIVVAIAVIGGLAYYLVNTPHPSQSPKIPLVTLLSYPETAKTSEPITISWKIDSEQGTIPHTAVHYGLSRIANPKNVGEYAFSSEYLCAQASCNIPGEFSVKISINNSGKYYFRAHAVIDGKDIWGEEKEITIQASSQPNQATENKTQPKTYNTEIRNYAFSPVELIIKKGDTVVWKNYDSVAHTVTSDSGSELASDYLPTGEEYSHTFNTEGTFDYHCIPHPNMKARIIVMP